MQAGSPRYSIFSRPLRLQSTSPKVRIPHAAGPAGPVFTVFGTTLRRASNDAAQMPIQLVSHRKTQEYNWMVNWMVDSEVQELTGVEEDERQSCEVLAMLDRDVKTPAAWANKRTAERKRLRAACTIHYTAPGGVTVLSSPGKTRDISGRGIGFLAKTAFAAGTSLRLVVSLPGHKAVNLTGKVVFSRPTLLRWYLVGMRFGSLEEEGLSPSVPPGQLYEPLNPSDGQT